VERCPHAWTLRYWADGKQRERSFKDAVRNGRTVYGSGRKLAQVAGDRDAVLDLLTETMGDLSISLRRQARMIIEGTFRRGRREAPIPATCRGRCVRERQGSRLRRGQTAVGLIRPGCRRAGRRGVPFRL
jgi:hypothetical protein